MLTAFLVLASVGFPSSYVGKQVWVFGASAFADQPFAWDPGKPVAITKIRRLSADWAQMGVPAWSWWPLGELTKNGFEATIQLPAEKGRYAINFQEGSLPNIEGFSKEPIVPHEALTGTFNFPNQQGFSRYASFDSPEKDLRASSKRVRTAFADRKVVVGMPKTLVVRLMGYPSLDSISALWKQRHWSYGGPAPYEYAIEFDTKNRVKTCGIEGTLP
jgi:hypothetical protein